MSSKSEKINILLKAVGDAPIMKQKNWTVDGSRNVAWLLDFLKKYFNLDSSESLFIFVNQAFAPSFDHHLSTLHECFSPSPDSKLVLHYSKTNAWG